MLSLIWMRRDLRLDDHAPLATALAAQLPVQPVFVFDSDILARFTNPADRRLRFLAETLCHLDTQLRAWGGRMLVLHGRAAELMPRLAATLSAAGMYCAEDLEPATRARDAAVKAALPTTTRFVQVLDHLLVHPQDTVKADGTPYKVFTPFYKQWRNKVGVETLAEYQVQDAGRYAQAEAVFHAVDAAGFSRVALEDGAAGVLAQIGYRHAPDPLWTVDDAPARLTRFIVNRLQAYPAARDVMAMPGTSQISPYLRFGLVSVRQCVAAAIAAGGGEKWIAELGWREFYASILYHFPQVVTQEFNPLYRGTIPWVDNPEHIAAFREGRTGYPVVDAAVRELLTTGFMHNRARMIVASFATKDLLMDWRVGEEFFAQHLMDYELASNNGGWQWAASTGTDAAPYFRIFNPVLQSQKFDPDGEYIRRYVPELRRLHARDIHAPWETPLSTPADYPRPLVDHHAVKTRAVAVFKAAGQKRGA